MAAFRIYDSAGTGVYMPNANTTVCDIVGSYRAERVLGDDGQWILADMYASNIDVAVHYAEHGGSTFEAKDMSFLVGGTVIGEIAGLNLMVEPSRGETLFNTIANAGHDRMHGNNYSDLIHGGWGNDTILGWGGNDTLNGGDGADLIYGNQGQDIVYGNMGADTLYGGQDGDVLFGGQSSDAIYGNLGADIAYGNLGNDTLFGGQGNDVLYGGQGNDLLFGHLGNDTLVGGLGADRFSFGPGSAADLILGFDQASGDRIDLQGQTYSLGQDAQGNALLILSGGGTIDLVGVTQGQVSASFFA